MWLPFYEVKPGELQNRIVKKEMKTDPQTVDAYMESFPEEVRKLLRKVRSTVRKNAPEAVEGIAYGMPAYKANGKPLVYFAGYRSHLGFYATPTGHKEFAAELSGYKQGKGSVQFPLDKPIPYELIGRIVAFRVKENANKAKK